MGGGSWTRDSFATYSTSVGRSVDLSTGSVRGDYSAQDIYKMTRLNEDLNPMNVVRECCDSEEHPNSFPVIMALDVTGSMGHTAVEVAKKLDVIMTKLYDDNKVPDVEFAVMGIGDLAYDNAPIQISQFESDVRIAEHLDKIYFERGGGGNRYESYTAAWYMGLFHTKLDCHKRGKKGLIITMGDEPCNPYLPERPLRECLGECNEITETDKLAEMVQEKFDVYHIHVSHGTDYYKDEASESFAKYIGQEHVKSCTIDEIVDTICKIIVASYENRNGDEYVAIVESEEESSVTVSEGTGEGLPEISW